MTRGRDPEERGEHFLESVERTVRVLESFDPEHPHRTLSEVAAATGINRAVVRRVLLTLVDLGLLTLTGRRFAPAPRMLDLGFTYLANLGLPAYAQPYLAELSREIGETVALAVLDGDDVRYVGRADAPRLVGFVVPVGARSPAHVTSAGRLLLSLLPPADLDRYLEQVELVRYTEWTVTDPALLRGQLREARDRGWSHSNSEFDVGMEGVAVVVPGGTTPVALSAVFPVTRFAPADLERTVVAPLRRCADRIADRGHGGTRAPGISRPPTP
ncbi:IclR family transcriptional regulator domain-containing protein [Pseudonocardia alni]|uniref:IclR family transcriptional regulator domain-containing protein n=1 Tax=Pseudonocardia alni TaxID=33907 RepID=UPI00333201FC